MAERDASLTPSPEVLRQTITRRDMLALGGAALTAGLCGTGTPPAVAAPAANPLKDLAAAKGLVLGAAFAVHETEKPYGGDYTRAYLRDVAQITSELSFKMSTLRPAADTIDFGPADRTVAFATANGLKLRAHTLIWNDDLPAWVHRLGPGEVEHLLDTHLLTVMERYRGRVWAWDVVNEPIGPWDHQPGNLRKGPYLSAMGESYVARALRTARRHDPTALLVLNEAQTETADDNGATFRRSLLDVLKRLKSEAVPLDAVGLQAHLRSDRPYDMGVFTGFLDEIAALGYAIHITECDVNDSAFPADVTARDAAVAELYGRFLKPVLAHKAVTALSFWQLADHTSWLYYDDLVRRRSASRRPRPLPLDQAFRRKPAWHAIADAIRAMPPR